MHSTRRVGNWIYVPEKQQDGTYKYYRCDVPSEWENESNIPREVLDNLPKVEVTLREYALRCLRPAFHPHDDRLLVLILPEPERKSGGLILAPDPNKENDRPKRGMVITKGLNEGNATILNNEGDIIWFSYLAGNKIHHDGVDYQLIRATDVFGTEAPITELPEPMIIGSVG